MDELIERVNEMAYAQRLTKIFQHERALTFDWSRTWNDMVLVYQTKNTNDLYYYIVFNVRYD